jgi:hypothetical protein
VSGGEEAGKERSHGCDGDNGAAAAIPRWELEGSPPAAVATHKDCECDPQRPTPFGSAINRCAQLYLPVPAQKNHIWFFEYS